MIMVGIGVMGLGEREGSREGVIGVRAVSGQEEFRNDVASTFHATQ